MSEHFSESVRGQLVEHFFDGKVPAEAESLFSDLYRDLKERGYPVESVVPLLGLQGEWAIKGLVKRERVGGDVDWGVVVNCKPEDKDKVVREIAEVGAEFMRSRGQTPCSEVNPVLYNLNLTEFPEMAGSLVAACVDYKNGMPGSFRTMVCASLPLLSADVNIANKFLNIVNKTLKAEDREQIFQAIKSCMDWMRDAKEKPGLNPEQQRQINLLRRIPHEQTDKAEKIEGTERSFGIIAVKPAGMEGEVSEIVDYVLALAGTEKLENDQVLPFLTHGMNQEQKSFFLGGLRKIDAKFVKLVHSGESEVFWNAAYAREAQNQFWYGDLINMISKGQSDAYMIEGSMSEKELERWLELFKGRENIIKTTGVDTEIFQHGRGIRGLYDSEAVMVNKDLLLTSVAENQNISSDEVKRWTDLIGKDEVLYVDLPHDIAACVWKNLNESQKKAMLNNVIHMSGNQAEVLDGAIILLKPVLGDKIVNMMKQEQTTPYETLKMMINAINLIKNGPHDTQGNQPTT